MEDDEDKENINRKIFHFNSEIRPTFRADVLARLSECGTEEEAEALEIKTECSENDRPYDGNTKEVKVEAMSLEDEINKVKNEVVNEKNFDFAESAAKVFKHSNDDANKLSFEEKLAEKLKSDFIKDVKFELAKDDEVEEEFQEIKPSHTSNVKYVHDSNKEKRKETSGVSISDYVYGELRRGYMLENDEQRFAEKREKCYRFFKIPREIEKFIFYGFFQCIDAFLFMFTFLPLRSIVSLWFLVTRSLKLIFCSIFGGRRQTSRFLQPAEICDLLKGIIVITVSFALTYIDSSMLYHIVKSQSVIKLYIMFNMLEVADRLFSSFGQDILDALYWTATEPKGRKREHIGLLPHFFLSVTYVFAHSVIVLLQATTLNVAINSQNKALLTIVLSNNFVELKTMVFRKFGKDNLFQVSCSDIRERFHSLILLFLVIIQTMKEYNWDKGQFLVLFPYCLGVFSAEMLVDWTKHAFITKYNEISFDVYKDYTVSLAYDLVSCKLKSAFSDHSDLMSRRMAFIPLPLCALVLRVLVGSIPISGIFGGVSVFLTYLCLVSAKLWINIILLGKACNKIEAHRNLQKEKCPTRQCTSLPSSRHHSAENLQEMDLKPKSVPQSQCTSMSSSLADIASEAQIRQEVMEPNCMFSNSTVSLNSLGGINDNLFNEQFVTDKPESGERWKATATFGGILRVPHEPLKRRISLQEGVKLHDNSTN